MQIKNENIVIPENNPFQNDKLNREVIANNLESIIDSVSSSLVLSIDSSWGKGKSTFVNMWRARIEFNQKYNTLYFNAWENDDCNDPLLAMISEMESTLLKGDDYATIVDKLKKYGTPLLKSAIPTALKLLTGNIINVNDFKDKLEELAGEVGKAGISLYKEEKNNRSKFKNALIEYQKFADKKVLFFIDELDRCRPTFAIETLEKIKHLFNIPNFIFILSLDKEQLSYSVQTLYGQSMDANNYLRRFLDLEYSLPEPNTDIYIDYLLDYYHLENGKTNYFKLSLKSLSKINNLTLRELDKLFNYISIIFPMTELYNNTVYDPQYLLLYGVIYSFFPLLRIKWGNLFNQFVNGVRIFDTMTPININVLNYYEYDDLFKPYFDSIIYRLVNLNSNLKEKNTLPTNLIIQSSDLPEINLSILLNQNNNKTLNFVDLMLFVGDFRV